MMHRLVALALVASVGTASVGCGTLLNDKYATITPPPGGFVDGVPGPVRADQSQAHTVMYPNGAQCLIAPNLSVGYLVADILITFLLGVVIDAVTGNWNVLDARSCPGVFVQD